MLIITYLRTYSFKINCVIYYIPLLVSEGAALKLLANRRCEGGVCVIVLASFFSKVLPGVQGEMSSQIIEG